MVVGHKRRQRAQAQSTRQRTALGQGFLNLAAVTLGRRVEQRGRCHEHSHGCEGLKGFGGLGHGSTGVDRVPDCAPAALPLASAMLLRYS